MAGRKPRLTEDVILKILNAVRLGATVKAACGYAGVSEPTYYRHAATNRALQERVENARGAAQVQWLAKIEQAAAEGTWQAAAWKLERLYPQTYGRVVAEVQHTGKDGGPLQFAGIVVPLPVRPDDEPEPEAIDVSVQAVS